MIVIITTKRLRKSAQRKELTSQPNHIYQQKCDIYAKNE